MRLLIVLGWAWACLGTDGLDVKIQLGEEVVLKPQGDVSNPSSIVWKYGNDIAADYFGSETTYYDPFKERGYLNNMTGEFTIRNVALTDTNNYTPEINNIIQEGIKLKVYLSVPKPEIRREGNTFTCSGDISGVEELSYSWSFPGGTFSNSSWIQLEEKCPKNLTCTMRNPVSEMKSDPFKCPNITAIVIAVVVVLLVLVGAVLGFHKVKTKEWFWQKGGKFWKSDFWKDTTTQSPPGNGASPDEGKPMNEKP